MYLRDKLTVDGVRRDAGGNLVASVLCARTGCQDYAGYEVGKPELDRVTVYRPPEEVFTPDSMRSYAGAPVTIEHPSEPVTPANWKDHAVGEVASDDIVKDGEAIRVPFMLRDAAAIDTVERGKRQISMGYNCKLDFVDGVAPDGTAYQAIQRDIRINHLAIVDRARGGPSLKIGDKQMSTKTITYDGLPLEVTDASEAVINKLSAKVVDGEKALADTKSEHDKAMAAKDAEIDDLKTKVVDQAHIDALADAKAEVVSKAKAIVGDKLPDTAGKTVAEVRRMTVAAKLGDAAVADKSDDYVEARFDTLADAKPNTPTVTPIRAPVNMGDAANDRKEINDARAKWLADKQFAHKDKA